MSGFLFKYTIVVVYGMKTFQAKALRSKNAKSNLQSGADVQREVICARKGILLAEIR